MVDDVVATPCCVELGKDIVIDHGLPLRALFPIYSSIVEKNSPYRLLHLTSLPCIVVESKIILLNPNDPPYINAYGEEPNSRALAKRGRDLLSMFP